MVNLKNLCPVCGYGMDDPPRDYNICPSCGTEFGLHDANASIVELRAAWLATGLRWWSATDPAPADWNPLEQVKNVAGHIGFGIALTVSAPIAFSGSLSQLDELAPVKFPEPAGIPHATGYLYRADR